MGRRLTTTAAGWIAVGLGAVHMVVAPLEDRRTLAGAWADGRSTSTPAGAPDYGLRDLVADAAGLVERLGPGPAHVVGMSMGSAIGQLLALDHPDRVRTLTLMSGTPGGPGHGAPDLPPMSAALAAMFTGEQAEPDWSDRDAVVEYHVAGERAYTGSLPFDEQDGARSPGGPSTGLPTARRASPTTSCSTPASPGGTGSPASPHRCWCCTAPTTRSYRRATARPSPRRYPGHGWSRCRGRATSRPRGRGGTWCSRRPWSTRGRDRPGSHPVAAVHTCCNGCEPRRRGANRSGPASPVAAPGERGDQSRSRAASRADPTAVSSSGVASPSCSPSRLTSTRSSVRRAPSSRPPPVRAACRGPSPRGGCRGPPAHLRRAGHPS